VNRRDYSGGDAATGPAGPAVAARAAGGRCEGAIPGALAGRRLDQALATLLPDHSRTRIRQWIADGRVRLDDAPATPSQHVHGGEAWVVDVPVPAALADVAEDIALAIVHEDDAILVLDKPAGLVVHPGSGNAAGTLLNGLLHHRPAQAALPRAGIVHRLDKDTSGLMVVAKTAAAYAALVHDLAQRSVTREYLAVVRGVVTRALTIDAPIGRHPVNRTAMAVVERGKPARTHVAPLEAFGVATLVRCRLETGRTHQIRVHLAAAGHPLVGDPAYGGRKAQGGVLAFPRQALHATRLALVHPKTGQHVAFESAPPADFAALVAALAEHARHR
jgi:23S rRNA pseudouridine1911/1915/1917 synthase